MSRKFRCITGKIVNAKTRLFTKGANLRIQVDSADRDLRRLWGKRPRCYTSAARRGRFDAPLAYPDTRGAEVLTSVATGRRLAQRAIAWQAIAIAVTALAFLAKGGAWALAAGLGGAAIAVGGWLSSVVALGGGVNPSAGALARLLAGVALKWVVVVAVLLLGVGKAGLSPVPMLVGVIVALFAQLLAMARPLARH